MKLTVTASGSFVFITVFVWQTQCSHEFAFTAGTAWAAKLLAQAINDNLKDHMRRERAKEYEDGWRDARAKKRAKRTFFTSLWERS